MTTSRHHYLICYDIRDDKRWRKCHKLMKTYGEAVQYSVFQCQLTDLRMAKLRWELAAILADEDSLLIAPIQAPDVNRIVQWNLQSIIKDRTDRFRTF